ncbi:hypothetical protein [Arcanobacterium pinnipediorum]|uniref:Transcriptional regulator, AbiEi antitoxin, Type IV TA system n=1 Tax=Arcanobacterium pinnipediorum TaxID=1503041 RepID=A0ABY5AIX1_9ACTO|nr:hypothetical protein [Arcanobacterium pinnipediorum]USR80169.1 hypothetical protein NG665_04145 [Arcanobacterium pinnipediorum]
MYPLVIRPRTLAELHTCLSLQREGNLIELGGLGWIASDFVASIEQRAGIIASLCDPNIAITHVGAYWVYTGITTVELSRSLHLCSISGKHSKGYPRMKIGIEDIAKIGSTYITTMERTVIDILRNDLATGTEALCAMLRLGASFDRILHLAQQLKNHPGMRKVREVLFQFPDEVIKTINSHSVSD